MKNNPLLYINSPSTDVTEAGLQKCFDSRKVLIKKNEDLIKTIHSLAQIIPLKEVVVTIKVNSIVYEGILQKYDENNQILVLEECEGRRSIAVSEIKDFNLISIK